MTDFLLNLLRTAPILSALLVVAAVKTKRPRRVQQIGFPILASIYLIVSLIILYRFNDVIVSAIRAITDVLPFGGFSMGTSWLLLSENVFVVLAFGLVKLFLMPVTALVIKKWPDFVGSTASAFYEPAEESGDWYLLRRHANTRTFLGVVYWTSVVIALLMLTLSLTYSSWPGFASIAFPALAAMVIGEFYFAIDGITQSESKAIIQGERDSSLRIANYGPLRSILRQTFPDRVLADDVMISSRANLGSGFKVGEMSRSHDEIESLAGAYFDQRTQARKDVDVNLVTAAVELMRGSSVLINNPFYSDLTPYVSLPAYHTLLRSRKVLIVAGRDSLSDDLAQWITEGLEEITGVPQLWNVEVLTPHGRSGLHVGVLRFADVHNLELLQNNQEFLSQVEYVILAEPSHMLATGQLGLSLVLSKCGSSKRPAFVAFDGNHDGLVDALSHLLKISLTEVVASSLPQSSSSEIIWKSEGSNMHTAVLPNVSRYLGMGTEIAAVALKYQVKSVNWIGGDAFPVVDMRWIAEQYYPQINSFADLDLSQDALRDALVARANPWDLDQDENYFLVVEDEIANAYETIRRFATRATSSGFVNLISDDYLLRDYMVDNQSLFAADPKAIPSIVSDFARTERNVVLRMLLSLVSFPMSESEIAREFELIGTHVPQAAPSEHVGVIADWEPPVITLLRNRITEHTNIVDVPLRRVSAREIGVVAKEGEIYYQIDADASLEQVMHSLRPAYFFVEDELEDQNRIGSLLYDHVYQALLPGQFLTYGGKYFEVQSISPSFSSSGVVLRRAAEHIRDRRKYRQLRTYTLTQIADQQAVGSVTDYAGILIRRAVANISVETHGYLEQTSRAAVSNARQIRIESVPPREYLNKAILEIRLPGIAPSVRKTLTVLLNELFVTVYPHAHAYVRALTSDETHEFGTLLTEFQGDVNPEAIYIVEDSTIDLGLVVSIERNWQRFLEIVTDYLKWNATPVPEPREEPKPEAKGEVVFPEVPKAKKKLGWFGRLRERFIGRGEKEEKVAAPVPPEPQAPAVEVEGSEVAIVEEHVDEPVGEPAEDATAEQVNGNESAEGNDETVAIDEPTSEVISDDPAAEERKNEE